MHHTSRAWVALLGLMFMAAPASGAWEGRIEEHAGVEHIFNPEVPLAGRREIPLTHLWTIGTEADDEIFGDVIAATHDDAGNILILDGQLVSARAFTPTGELHAVYGRQGEGPGEYQRPREIFPLPDGLIGVSDSRPPKIARFSSDGTPVGDLTLRGLTPSDGGRLIATVMAVAGDHCAAELRHMVRDENRRVQRIWIASVSAAGTPLQTFLAREETVAFGEMRISDRDETFDVGFWTLDASGHVYARLERDVYQVGCFAPDGTLVRVIHRAGLRARRRSAAQLAALEERSLNRPRRGPRHGSLAFDFAFAETHPLITGLWIGPAGRLWIRADDHRRGLPEEGVERLALFDEEGCYLHEVVLRANPPIHPRKIFHSGPYVITFGEGAAGSSMPDPLDEDLEAVTPTVSCYRMEF